MEEPSSELEDGEISSGDDTYTPLERPTNYSSLVQPKIVIPYDSESEDEIQSSRDSDSDIDSNPKKPKLVRKNIIPTHSPRKKNDIWCGSAEEHALEDLINCDVGNIDRSRSVETYGIRRNNKRTHSDQNNESLLPIKRTDFDVPNWHKKKPVPRIILDLNVTVSDTEEDIAKDIAEKLSENQQGLIETVVNQLGKQKAIELFKETQQIEVDGGMLIMNHERRRTSGGVFLYLVKNDHDITYEQQQNIFSEDKWKHQRKFLLVSRKEPELKNPPPSPATDSVDNSIDTTVSHNTELASKTVVDHKDGITMDLV